MHHPLVPAATAQMLETQIFVFIVSPLNKTVWAAVMRGNPKDNVNANPVSYHSPSHHTSS